MSLYANGNVRYFCMFYEAYNSQTNKYWATVEKKNAKERKIQAKYILLTRREGIHVFSRIESLLKSTEGNWGIRTSNNCRIHAQCTHYRLYCRIQNTTNTYIIENNTSCSMPELWTQMNTFHFLLFSSRCKLASYNVFLPSPTLLSLLLAPLTTCSIIYNVHIFYLF